MLFLMELHYTEQFLVELIFLIKYGYGRLDSLLQEKENFKNPNPTLNNLILIAPSYGDNNLLHVCGIKLINLLLELNFKVMLRPHFRTLKESTKLIDEIKENFKKNPNFILEEGIIPYDSFYNSVCMISDWSGISLEYAFTFERPVIFIDVPKKILNQDSYEILLEPIEISIRNKVGHVVSPKNIEEIPSLIKDLEKKTHIMKEQIKDLRSITVYNITESAKIGANYIQQLISN